MSSEEDTHISPTSTEKRRRIERACDVCRRRKIRCNGFDGEGTKCAHCTQFNLECTDSAPKRKRGPIKGYVRTLESRLEQMETLLKRLHPELEKSSDGAFSIADKASPNVEGSSPASTHSAHYSNPDRDAAASPLASILTPPSLDPPAQAEESDYSSDESNVADLEKHGTMRWMQRWDATGGPGGYQGESSRALLVKDVFAFRDEYLSKNAPGYDLPGIRFPNRRPELWGPLPWDLVRNPILPDHDFDFPEPDLLEELVERFFNEINITFPLLNQVLFKRQIESGLHLIDRGFGSVLLLVAALGSRSSNDPRIYVDPTHTQSGGWKWFNQVQKSRESFTGPATIYDIQVLILMTVFMHGSSAPEAGWSLLGIGIRLATDVGAHRKKTYGPKPTVHGELWKRAFWTLICLDRHISNTMGRSCAIHDEDFDVDFPVECDDEYWFVSEPELAFKQPPGKPCSISHFIHLIKYFQIVAFALRTIYSINKSKVLMGFVGPDWEQRIVVQCDSALNEWKEAIPDHLRWDPQLEDHGRFVRSAQLHAFYYLLQITIHRPFILSRRRSPMPFPSLEICTNSARALSRLLGVLYERQIGPLPWEVLTAFTAGIVLLLHIWGNKKDGLIAGLQEEMDGLHTCMRVLKRCEKAWHVGGQYWDALYELASFGKLPMAADFPPRRSHKYGSGDRRASNIIPANPSTDPKVRVSRLASTTPLATESTSSSPIASSTRGVSLPSIDALTSLQDTAPLAPEPLNLFSVDPAVPIPTTSGHSANQWDQYAMPPMQDTVSNVNAATNVFPWSTWNDEYAFSGLDLHDSQVRNPMSLWSVAPTGFELDEWNLYINGVANVLNQPQPPLVGEFRQ